MVSQVGGGEMGTNGANVLSPSGSSFYVHPYYQSGKSKTTYRPTGKRSKRPDFKSWITGETQDPYSSYIVQPSPSGMTADKNMGTKSEFEIKHVVFAPVPQKPAAIISSWSSIRIK